MINNEKSLLNDSNLIKLVGFDKNSSEYNWETKIFSKVVFNISGNNPKVKEMFQSKMLFNKEIYEIKKTESNIFWANAAINGFNNKQRYEFNDDKLIINLDIELGKIQSLIDLVKSVLYECEQEIYEEKKAVDEELRKKEKDKENFDNAINSLKF